MNTENSKLYWTDSSEQTIPSVLPNESMILSGGWIEPELWIPEPEETTEAAWLLRYVPANLLIPIPEDGLTIGSSSVNILILDDPTISKIHVRLLPAEGGWQLEDLGSLNGTYFEGRQVFEPVLVREGGQFTLARGKTFMIEKVENDE